MTEKDASDEYLAELLQRKPPGVREVVVGMRAILTMMWHAKPFLQ